jgi:hypothetical protein
VQQERFQLQSQQLPKLLVSFVRQVHFSPATVLVRTAAGVQLVHFSLELAWQTLWIAHFVLLERTGLVQEELHQVTATCAVLVRIVQGWEWSFLKIALNARLETFVSLAKCPFACQGPIKQDGVWLTKQTVRSARREHSLHCMVLKLRIIAYLAYPGHSSQQSVLNLKICAHFAVLAHFNQALGWLMPVIVLSVLLENTKRGPVCYYWQIVQNVLLENISLV